MTATALESIRDSGNALFSAPISVESFQRAASATEPAVNYGQRGGLIARAVYTALLPLAAMGFFNATPSMSSSAIEVRSAGVSANRSSIRFRELEDVTERMLAFDASPFLDGDDARDMVRLAVMDALVFVQMLPSSVPLPWVSHNSDGEVFLKWNDGDRQAEAMFSGNDEVGYAIRKQGRFVAGAEEATSARIPNDLIEYFKA